MGNDSYYFYRKWQEQKRKEASYRFKRDIIFLFALVVAIAVGIGILTDLDVIRTQLRDMPKQTIIFVPAEIPEDGEIVLSTYDQAKLDLEKACEENDIDFKLALAISRLETGNFTSYAFNSYNNYGGISVKEVPVKYETKEAGLAAYMKTLSYYKDMTVDQMSKKYCPGNAKNWARIVKQLMKEAE